jgi:hypothetical protein
MNPGRNKKYSDRTKSKKAKTRKAIENMQPLIIWFK